MSNLLKNLLIAFGLAIVLFVGYVAFVKDDGSDTATVVSPVAELESQNLLSTLNELKSLDVRGEIFSDPLFLSLKDIRVPLGDEPAGRVNPFAPIQ